MQNRIKIVFVKTALFITILGLPSLVPAQKMDRIERASMKTMLNVIKDNIKKNYYDENFRGIDLEARFEAANKRLDEVETASEAFGVIAQALLDFDDSHLFFRPPATNLEVEYGFRTGMIGDQCIVTSVKPKSDAEKKGLERGDQLVSISGFPPTRSTYWKINYFLDVLRKQAGLNLSVIKPNTEKPVPIAIESKITKNPSVITLQSLFRVIETDVKTSMDLNLYASFGKIAYWKLPSFSMSPDNIDTLMKRIEHSDSLILDLRGNGGGAGITLERLAGYMFPKDLILATPKGRKKLDLVESKSRGSGGFSGRLIVLIDSQSASASEMFARTVQLEERGVVLGDISAGAVMMSRTYTFGLRNDSIVYGVSTTIADVIMPDGKSLEKVGVMPQLKILPTAEDIAKNRDPVLSAAVKLLGGELSPADAGALFEYEWLDTGEVITKMAKKE